MKILFIYSEERPISVRKPLCAPRKIQFGIAHLSSYLKQSGHETGLVVLSRSFGNKNYGILKDKIQDFKPDIIGFYSVESQYRFISNMSGFIKSNYPDTFLIIGGPHATLNPEEVAKDSFDAVCVGEGEKALLELTEMLEKGKLPTKIKNLWIKTDNTIEKNETAPFLEDLDLLPLADRTIWDDYISYNPLLGKNVSLLIGRGCPYSCAYCCNDSLKRVAGGNYVRLRSPRSIVEEIKLMHEKYPIENNFYFQIESFNTNHEWAIELCNEIEKYNKTLEAPLSFGANIRITPGTNFDPLFEACQRANLIDLFIGLESGSERIRKDILNRNYTNSDFMNTINSARKYNLDYYFFAMIGIPEETPEDYYETIEVCRVCQPKEILLSIFYPYPGTSLYKLCQEMNLLREKTDINREERRQPTLNLPYFTRRQLQRNYIFFNYNVYKGYKSRISLIKEVMIKFFGYNPFTDAVVNRYLTSHSILKLKKILGAG
jgi:anaerobic magnesium-protoporphyrin IX monomethyl ester cyclase